MVGVAGLGRAVLSSAGMGWVGEEAVGEGLDWAGRGCVGLCGIDTEVAAMVSSKASQNRL